MALSKAIIAAYQANGTLMGLTVGGIRKDMGNKELFDYVIVSEIPSNATHTYDDNPIADVTVTLNLMSNKGGEVAMATAKAIRDAFKDAILSLDEGVVLNVQLARPLHVMVLKRKDKDGNTVVMVPIEIRYSLQLW